MDESIHILLCTNCDRYVEVIHTSKVWKVSGTVKVVIVQVEVKCKFCENIIKSGKSDVHLEDREW